MPTNTIPMTATPESGQIGAYGYDASSKTLAVQFKNGLKVYLYPNVEPETAAMFTGADSKGKAFFALIKGREFTCVEPIAPNPKAEPAPWDGDPAITRSPIAY